MMVNVSKIVFLVKILLAFSFDLLSIFIKILIKVKMFKNLTKAKDVWPTSNIKRDF
jgi:hypothetical protein